MDEAEFQRQIAQLKQEWGGVYVDKEMPGYVRANNDPMTGALIGIRAPLFAEIINRALDAI